MKSKTLISRLMGGAFLASLVMAQTPGWSITTKSAQQQQQQAAAGAVAAAAAANANLIFGAQADLNAIYADLHNMVQHHPAAPPAVVGANRTAANLRAYVNAVVGVIGNIPNNFFNGLHAPTAAALPFADWAALFKNSIHQTLNQNQANHDLRVGSAINHAADGISTARGDFAATVNHFANAGHGGAVIY